MSLKFAANAMKLKKNFEDSTCVQGSTGASVRNVRSAETYDTSVRFKRGKIAMLTTIAAAHTCESTMQKIKKSLQSIEKSLERSTRAIIGTTSKTKKINNKKPGYPEKVPGLNNRGVSNEQ